MRDMRKRVLLAVLLAVCGCLLTGCGDAVHYKAVEKKAASYYKQKYGGRKPEIVDSFKAGNSGLFGYIGVKDRAYELEDGTFIYWDDDEETFADTRQAAEINKALTETIVEPALDAVGVPVTCANYTFNRTGFDSFDESVFTALYEGDIVSYAMKEKPEAYDLRIALRAESGFDHEAAVGNFYKALKPYLSGTAEAIVFEESGDPLPDISDVWYSISSPTVVSTATLDFEDGIRWYRNVYIEVMPGVFMTSDIADFVLEEGDITFKQIGTCADLQKRLDEAYYALPVDAEENKNGGYTVHDQRHEKRVVLDDPASPLYEIQMSERVLERLDSYGKMAVYVRMERDDGLPLMTALAPDDNSYSVYYVLTGPEDGPRYESISPGALFYFGTHHMVGLDESESGDGPDESAGSLGSSGGDGAGSSVSEGSDDTESGGAHGTFSGN